MQGDSTQHRGVVPDVAFPSGLSSKEQGERALKHALPFARIAPANFDPVSEPLPNLDDLRRIRRELSQVIAEHCGPEVYTRIVEDAYRKMWRTWCAS